MKYLSEKLISDIKKQGIEIKLCDFQKLQTTIRGYFIKVHENAVDDTVRAMNKKNFNRPNFEDKL